MAANFISKDEMIVIANALIEEGLIFYEPSCGAPLYYCQFCDAELRGWDAEKENFLHNDNCPVVVAESVLKRLQ